MQLVDPRPPRPLPIRITPLIDVVFILLVFFMLTSHLLPTGFLELDSRSPEAGASAGTTRAELQLTASGQIRWQQQDWPLPALIRELQQQGSNEINLGTAADTRLTDFTRTLSTLENAGISVHWRREPTQEPQPAQ